MTEKIDKILQDAAVATGNGEAFDIAGYGAIAFQVTGITTATVTFETTIDGANWVSMQLGNVASGAVATTATADGVYAGVIAGLQQVRARVSAWTSGTIYVTALATASSGGQVLADIDIGATEDVTVSSIAAGDNNIGNMDVVTVNGVAPQFDDTDKLAVSLYAKDAAAGDTALITSDEGHLATISYERFHLHEGQLFTAHVDNAVTNIGEMSVIAFNTPASGAIHVWVEGSSTHTADLYLYENTSIDVDEGTDLTPINRRRTGTPPTSTLSTIETAPEVGKVTLFLETAAATANITTTTEIDHAPIIGGSGPKALGGSGSDDLGYILANSQQYAIVIAAGTNDDATHHLDVIWTEV